MIAFFIGILMGIVFFGGLYLTVQKLSEVRNPALLMGVSFIARMAVLLAGFYYVSKDGYRQILFALLGAIAVRFIMIFLVNSPKARPEKRGD